MNLIHYYLRYQRFLYKIMESTNAIDFISHSEKDIENFREINSILNVDFDEVIEVLESQNIIKNEVAAICNNVSMFGLY